MDADFALFQQILEQPSAEDNNMAARFYDKAVKTSELTSNGLPIFKNVTYIEIRLKDNSTEVFNQPASQDKIRRFPKEYALYRLAKKQTEDGTPLEQFAFLDAAEIATCKNRGIFTVEALANLTEEKIKNLGLQEEHKLACLFLDQSKQNDKLQKLAAIEEAYKNEIAELKEKIELLETKLKQRKTSTRKVMVKEGEE